MAATATSRDEILAHAYELLGLLSQRKGFDPTRVALDCKSDVELQALCRILYELLYNPPPRAPR